jgi:predicted TIM-barrel enzyme
MTRAKLSDAAGFWIDNAGVYEGHMSEEFAATSAFLETRMFNVYAGFNFKYQPCDNDPAASMKVIQDAGFIPCTSGPGTGEAPDLEYLSALRAKVPEGRLAIASGVTPANVAKFHGLVTDILVGTGISSSFYEIDPVKLEALLEAIRR